MGHDSILSREPNLHNARRQETRRTFQPFRAYRPQPKTAIPPSVFGHNNGGKKRADTMNEKKNNRYRTFARMVDRGSNSAPAKYAIMCGKLTGAEIARLLAVRGLDEIATITAAGKPLDGLRAVWACYTIAAENGFSTPYDGTLALDAKSNIDNLDEKKAALNAINRKITAAKKTAEIIFRANNSEPTEADYPNGGLAAAREAWEIALVKARNEAETPEMREEYNSANETYNAAKVAYADACKEFDDEYMARIDRLRAGLSPLKQCGAENVNA